VYSLRCTLLTAICRVGPILDVRNRFVGQTVSGADFCPLLLFQRPPASVVVRGYKLCIEPLLARPALFGALDWLAELLAVELGVLALAAADLLGLCLMPFHRLVALDSKLGRAWEERMVERAAKDVLHRLGEAVARHAFEGNEVAGLT